MAARFSTKARNDAADGRLSGVDTLDVYTGTQPASANDAPSGTLLGTVTGITWGAASGGAASVSGSTPDDSADNSGTAGWGRFSASGDGTKKMDGAVGVEFTLADADIVAGGTITLTSATLTEASGE